MAIINGTAGNDELITVESNDELLGLEGNDFLDAVSGKGNNILRGGAGDDELFAYSEDELYGDEGDDDLYSDGQGNNILDGGEGNDEIFPDRNDTVDGGIGDDVIFAGRGGNTFTGGSGQDVFWIANVESSENPNIITDFNFTEDTIRVDLSGVENFTDFLITQQGNDTIISALGRQLAIFQGVAPSQLNEKNLVTDKDAPNNPGLNQPTIEDATFSIQENSAGGTLVGALEAADPDQGDILTYSITDGNLDIDGDGNSAFSINSTGQIIVNDSGDLDFETNPNFNLSVTVTDNFDLSDTANVVINLQDEPLPQFDIEQSKQGIFSLIGDTRETANFLLSLVSVDAGNINEIGLFAVDENGAVNGKTPDSPDYIQEALQQSQIVFSAINNQPNGYAELDKTRILEGYQSGDRLVFYLVKNSTTDSVISGKTSSDNVLLGSTFASDAFAQVKIVDMGDGKFELAWEDEVGGGDEDFNDLVLNLEITNKSAPDGTNLQDGNPPELIDLREFAGETVKMTAQIFREAAFENQVVFYKVDSADGIIGSFDPNTASQRDYLSEALKNLVKDINGDVVKLGVENQSTASFIAELEAGSIFAPMIIIDGSLEQLQDADTSNDPTVYFPYIGANSDTVDHMRLLGDNTFGFEDLANGGDMDYNDIIVKIDFN